MKIKFQIFSEKVDDPVCLLDIWVKNIKQNLCQKINIGMMTTYEMD